MMASALQSYVNRFSVLPGKKVVLFTNNDSVYSVAKDIISAGGKVVAIIDARASGPDSEVIKALNSVRVISNSVIQRVIGYKKVKSVKVSSNKGTYLESISCDLVAHSGGWNPTVHLHSQARGTLKYCDSISAFVPDKSIQKSWSVGAASGKLLLQEAFSTAVYVSECILEELSLKKSNMDVPLSLIHI